MISRSLLVRLQSAEREQVNHIAKLRAGYQGDWSAVEPAIAVNFADFQAVMRFVEQALAKGSSIAAE